MRILVTGGTGFIGSAFINHALSQGHKIAALTRSGAGPTAHPALSWIKGTLENPDWEAISRWKPETLLHAAWIATPGVYLDAPENPLYVSASRDFIAAAVQRSVSHCVALGTCIEYLASDKPLDEDTSPLDPHPRHAYIKAKQALHALLQQDSRRGDWSLAWGRIFYPYGPGEHPRRFCSQLIRDFQSGTSVTLKTPASIKDYIYIEDVARALLTLCETRTDGAYNVSTGSGVSVHHLAARLEELVDRRGLICEEPTVVDPFPFVVGDNRRLRELGWKPATPLEGGLKELISAILRP